MLALQVLRHSAAARAEASDVLCVHCWQWHSTSAAQPLTGGCHIFKGTCLLPLGTDVRAASLRCANSVLHGCKTCWH